MRCIEKTKLYLKSSIGLNIGGGHRALCQIDLKEFFSGNGSIPKLNYGSDSTNLLMLLNCILQVGD